MGPRLIDGRVGMVFFGVGGSRSARALHYFALLFLGGGCFFFFWGGFWGGANNLLGWPSCKIFSWTCCYAIHSSLALYLATRYQLLLVTCKTLLMLRSQLLLVTCKTLLMPRSFL